MYDREYEESILECMAPDPVGAARLLASHRAHVAGLRRSEAMAGLLDTLSVLKCPIA